MSLYLIRTRDDLLHLRAREDLAAVSVRILEGDCREVLKTLPDESVHCVVTSPPYFGLRDYGTAAWLGGDDECDHIMPPLGGSGKETIVGTTSNGNGTRYQQYRETCGKCGARRIDSQIGLESSPDEYVAELVAVFREVRRVMRKDATLWLNLGDSYAGSGPSGASYQSATTMAREGKARDGKFAISSTLGQRGLTYAEKKPVAPPGLKPKDLCGIPWRVAFALQADGWWLRQDIIWHKPNPMPESVTDRCTKSHEYIFLMAKAERYYYDAAAIAEPAINVGVVVKTNGADGMSDFGDGMRTREGFGRGITVADTRNKRSVWTVTTKAYTDAHFATFPPDLIEPCILAGCPEGGTVLDPFGGAGTTGLVADRLQRNAILIELNPQYAEMARGRIIGDAPLFAEVS